MRLRVVVQVEVTAVCRTFFHCALPDAMCSPRCSAVSVTRSRALIANTAVRAHAAKMTVPARRPVSWPSAAAPSTAARSGRSYHGAYSVPGPGGEGGSGGQMSKPASDLRRSLRVVRRYVILVGLAAAAGLLAGATAAAVSPVMVT